MSKRTRQRAMKDARQISFKWERDVIQQADEMAKKRGLTRSALIQLIIRERAAGEGVL